MYLYIHPQVSELCPGEYPTTINILITDSIDDSAIQNIKLIEGSQDNILTTVDNITLQSDMIYTIQVSFSNLDGKFNITSSANISKFSVVIIIMFISAETNTPLLVFELFTCLLIINCLNCLLLIITPPFCCM